MTENIEPNGPAAEPATQLAAPVIKPTVDRVVWYAADDTDERQPHGVQPYAAIIAYVHSDDLVNLTVFGHDGVPFSKQKVTLLQNGNAAEFPGSCMWMPYQKGQAAKTEALEKAQAAAKPD